MGVIKLNDCLCGHPARWKGKGLTSRPYCPNCQAVGLEVSIGNWAKAAEVWNINTAPRKK